MESNKDDLKTQFIVREGCYQLQNLSEYSRPNRVGYQSNQNLPQVRVSFVSLPQSSTQTSAAQQQQSLEKGSTAANTNTVNGNNAGSTSNGPLPTSNSLSSATTVATVTSLTNGLQQEHNDLNQNNVPSGDWICFNFGKELYTHVYHGVKKAADLSKPIDKKLYKGTNPSCHNFNQTASTSEGAPLLVGFTTGQIQLVYPGRRETGKLYNEERLIDKTKVTCLKWLPNSSNLFLAAHASGHLYLYNEELPCSPATPVYQPFKGGDGYTILACKSKSTRNPLYKWSFGVNCAAANGNGSSSSSSSSSSTISSSSSSFSCASDNCSINEFCFSPDGASLAIVSQDGFLRVFHYDTMELVCIARSYFGGFLCVCWSPDGKYIAVGGEDDLVTIYSFSEKRVVARGHGHRSWVSVVAFDPYTTFTSWDSNDFSDDENQYEISSNSKRVRSASIRDSTLTPDKMNCYRLGSVSQDTQLCLWDITEDVLRPHTRVRLSTLDPTSQQVSQNKAEPVQMNGDCSGLVGGEKPASALLVKDKVDNSLSNSHTAKIVNSSAKTSVDGTAESCGVGTSKKSKSTSLASVVGNSSNSNLSSTKIITNDDKSNNHNHSAFNTLTQRFTNFSFGSDKSSKGNKRNYSTTGKGNGTHPADQKSGQNCDANSATSTLRNKSNGSIVTYDAMKLIGTPACPRYDECPVLEPLVCKKIAHERLTALVFREDCFVTACQDGFVYTWARKANF